MYFPLSQPFRFQIIWDGQNISISLLTLWYRRIVKKMINIFFPFQQFRIKNQLTQDAQYGHEIPIICRLDNRDASIFIHCS